MLPSYDSSFQLSKKDVVRPYQYALVLTAVGCLTFGVVWFAMLTSALHQLEACTASPSSSQSRYLVFDPLYIQGAGQKR
jgi:hypothetical protein